MFRNRALCHFPDFALLDILMDVFRALSGKYGYLLAISESGCMSLFELWLIKVLSYQLSRDVQTPKNISDPKVKPSIYFPLHPHSHP